MSTRDAIKPSTTETPEVTPSVDAFEILREILELQRESDPSLNVEEVLAYAIAHPESEVVDSLGAVTITCMQYGAYSPDNLIPSHLLTHDNFSTLNGLRKVISELEKRARQ